MKASNIFLTAIISFMFISVIGSNLVLKKEFDKIDRMDQFTGYDKAVLKPFKYVKLEGKEIGLVEFQQSKEFEIRMITEQKYLNWKVEADTLTVTFKRDWTGHRVGPELRFQSGAAVYILAPQLSGIESYDVDSKISKWKGSELNIKQEKGSIMLAGNSIENLNAELSFGSYLQINPDNQLGKTNIQVKDTSRLVVQKDVFKSFKTTADSSAMVNLPASLVKKVNQ